MPQHHTRRAFTLIELLVVITIIVVLLALLTPALDKAVYQAQLATCESKLDAIASTAILYALNSRREYPHRAGAVSQTNWTPHMIGNLTSPHLDERKALRGYFPLNKLLNCPLAGYLDIEGANSQATGVAGQAYATATVLFCGYDLWFGWQWEGGKVMRKLGDRVEYTQDGITGQSDVLAGDFSVVKDGSYAFAGHPDRDGILYQQVFNNEVFSTNSQYLRYTLAWWRDVSCTRGPVDLNYAYQDGSVHRLVEVRRDDDQDADDRVARASAFRSPSQEPGRHLQLPEH